MKQKSPPYTDKIVYVNKLAYEKDNPDKLFTGSCGFTTDETDWIIQKFENGVLVYQSVQLKTGMSETFFLGNGVTRVIIYDENGLKRFDNHFKDLVLCGETIIYDDEGKPMIRQNYLDGRKIEEQFL
ncbi:hypothetical protein [Parapedobacter lycopersici]|uniref:hypothetical protein n=1 Tax=Parapedobacter lycopersici TaxID=1864939 RepID=UPI00214D2004|nr:hypothetical protein [Parapedobacter lycopersici]